MLHTVGRQPVHGKAMAVDVRRVPFHVLAVADTAHVIVVVRATVAAGHDDGHADVLAHVVQLLQQHRVHAARRQSPTTAAGKLTQVKVP